MIFLIDRKTRLVIKCILLLKRKDIIMKIIDEDTNLKMKTDMREIRMTNMQIKCIYLTI